MPIESRLEAGAAIVMISGRLTLGREVEHLEAVVNDLLIQGQWKFVFDIAGLEYTDSAGIGTIVSCLTNVRKSGGEIRVAGANPRIQKMFKITGVEGLMPMYPSVPEAIAG